jgi:hypothetical protein
MQVLLRLASLKADLACPAALSEPWVEGALRAESLAVLCVCVCVRVLGGGGCECCEV